MYNRLYCGILCCVNVKRQWYTQFVTPSQYGVRSALYVLSRSPTGRKINLYRRHRRFSRHCNGGITTPRTSLVKPKRWIVDQDTYQPKDPLCNCGWTRMPKTNRAVALELFLLPPLRTIRLMQHLPANIDTPVNLTKPSFIVNLNPKKQELSHAH